MKYPWGDNRPYNSYSRYFREKFGTRVQKVAIDAGFSCPNRDGTLGAGGCDFCNNEGFNPSYCNPDKTITQQIEEGIEFHKWRYKKAVSYLAYFQAYSNTYGNTGRLITLYEQALSHHAIKGLVIGTRPDCIADDLLDYLSRLREIYYVHIEFGIESVYDTTLDLINRGHNFAAAREALDRCKDRGISTGAHFIFGLPGESSEMMMESVRVISELPINTIKFHQLQILRNTRFEALYNEDPSLFNLFSFGDYIHFIVNFLERLNPEIVVERFAGEVPPRFRIAPDWGMIRNEEIVAETEKQLIRHNTWQGKLWEKR